MARQPIIINEVEFKYQQEALKYFKDILASYQNGQTITGNDHNMLLALLDRHPEGNRKIGCGVEFFFKDKTDKPTSCFWLERTDGSKTDFSYEKAVKAKEVPLRQQFHEACREFVRNDLWSSKKKHFENFSDQDGKVECAISGKRITFDESHLDHQTPLTFQVIVETFIHANDIAIKSEMLSTSQDAQFGKTITDTDLKRKFRRYHQRIAHLRVIEKELNLSLGGSQRIVKNSKTIFVPIELIDD